jgi:fructose transport system permease protein
MTDIATTSALTPEQELERLAPKTTPLDRAQRMLHRHPAIGPFIVLVAACIVFGLLNSRFASSVNISLMLQQVAVVAALGIAQTLIILTAGIDLSIGAAMILAQLIIAQTAANNHVPGLLALLLGLLVGVGTGVVNGAIITRFRIPPFIATLGTLSVFSSIGLIYSNGQTTQASQLPGVINWSGNPVSIGPFHLINGVLVVLAMYLIVTYILTRTTWGRHVFAVGDDHEAARLAGIRTNHGPVRRLRLRRTYHRRRRLGLDWLHGRGQPQQRRRRQPAVDHRRRDRRHKPVRRPRRGDRDAVRSPDRRRLHLRTHTGQRQ